MTVKQISVFIENKEGRMKKTMKALGKENINIRALSLADTSKYGILRLIVSDNEAAVKALEEDGFIVRETEVLVVFIPDQPNGLNTVLESFEKDKINVEYLYAFVSNKVDEAIVVMRLENMEAGKSALEKNNITILTEEDIKNL
ncbi:MAG: hypothetical protein MJ209_03540 [archaeon]|nr:hypothetical protein [archaeon]